MKRYKIATLQLLLLLAISGCATKYTSPDETKVVEANKKVRADVVKASTTSKQVTKHVTEAQVHADAIIVLSQTIMGKIEELITIAPLEFKPPLISIKQDLTDMRQEENVLAIGLSEAFAKQNLQDKTFVDMQDHILDLQGAQEGYREDVQVIIKKANKDSETLAWYRRHWWGSWIIFSLGVVVCIVLAVIKFGVKLYFWK